MGLDIPSLSWLSQLLVMGFFLAWYTVQHFIYFPPKPLHFKPWKYEMCFTEVTLAVFAVLSVFQTLYCIKEMLHDEQRRAAFKHSCKFVKQLRHKKQKSRQRFLWLWWVFCLMKQKVVTQNLRVSVNSEYFKQKQ